MSIRRLASRYFAAAAGSAAVSFLTLPLVTRILGPRDFGSVALVGAVTMIGTSFSTLGTSFVVYRHIPQANASERASIITTLAVYGMAIVGVWAVVAAGAYLVLKESVGVVADLPSAGVWLALAAMGAGPLWTIAMDVLTLEERAGVFATTLVAQALAGAGTTLFCLFALDLGVVALFAGNLVSSLWLGATGLWVLLPDLTRMPEARWRAEVRRVARSNLLPQASETGFTFVERLMLSRWEGLGPLGIYAHSQRYREVAALGIKSIGRGAWTAGLEEARRDDARFARTGRTWGVLHVVIAMAGVAFAAAGEHLVSVLTNNRLTAAADYIGPWFMILLAQNAARPQLATLFARGDGAAVARVNLASNVAGILALVALVPLWGAGGAVAAVACQVAVGRFGTILAARRYAATPLQDRWVLVGIILIAATMAVDAWLRPGVAGALVLLAGAEAVVLVAGRRPLVTAWRIMGSRS